MLYDINKLKKNVAQMQLELNDIKKVLRKLMTILYEIYEFQ